MRLFPRSSAIKWKSYIQNTTFWELLSQISLLFSYQIVCCYYMPLESPFDSYSVVPIPYSHDYKCKSYIQNTSFSTLISQISQLFSYQMIYYYIPLESSFWSLSNGVTHIFSRSKMPKLYSKYTVLLCLTPLLLFPHVLQHTYNIYDISNIDK